MALTKVHNRMSKGAPLSPYDFGAVGDGVADDTAAMVAWVAYLNADVENFGIVLPGIYNFNQTLNLTTRERAIVGVAPDAERTGTPRSGSATLRWTGANTDSMFSMNTARHKFAYINIECSTQARDFIEMISGAQALRLENVTFSNPSVGLAFSRAVIYSDGSRLGYSHFKDLLMGKVAPYFIQVVETTSTGITPINFEYCEFKNGIASGGGGGGGDPYTIYYSDGANLESLRFWRCTFVSKDGVTLADTRTNTPTFAIGSFVVNECELDNYSDDGYGFRAGYLTNVANISITNNILTGESPGQPYLFDLNNSNVVAYTGNRVKSITYIFDVDATSRVRGIGGNFEDWSSIQGITDASDAGLVQLTQATSITMDGTEFGPAETGIYECEITANTAYTFNLDITRPQNWENGQVFALTIKNTSGGTVPAPLFGSNFKVQAAAFTAPADGHHRTIMFKVDNAKACQITNETADIPNP